MQLEGRFRKVVLTNRKWFELQEALSEEDQWFFDAEKKAAAGDNPQEHGLEEELVIPQQAAQKEADLPVDVTVKLLLDKVEKMEQEAKEAENKRINANYERLKAKEALEGARPEAFVGSAVSRVAKARKDKKDRLIHTLLRCGTMPSIEDPDRMMARNQLNMEEDAIRARQKHEKIAVPLNEHHHCYNSTVDAQTGLMIRLVQIESASCLELSAEERLTVTACNASVYADMTAVRYKTNVLDEVLSRDWEEIRLHRRCTKCLNEKKWGLPRMHR